MHESNNVYITKQNIMYDLYINIIYYFLFFLQFLKCTIIFHSLTIGMNYLDIWIYMPNNSLKE